MKIKVITGLVALFLCVAAAGFWRAARRRQTFVYPPASYRTSWSPELAASYLNQREVWWQSWPPAHKDRGTLCISCHTVVPYALATPALQQRLGPTGSTSSTEQAVLTSVEKRVSDWPAMAAFYSDAAYGRGKTAESRSTEAVLNAVILASYDAGQKDLRPITRKAFDEAWALQEEKGWNAGGWQWEDFDLAPWESKESGYQGAALLAVALGNAPGRYANEPNIGEHMAQLRSYLKRQYSAQPVMSQLYVLWASARMPGLLNQTQRMKLLAKVKRLQQSDGGWALSALNRPVRWNWKWLDGTSASDGCATGLVVLALEESGVSRNEPMLAGGLEWLKHHQTEDGSWRATSLNVRRNPESDIGRFMSDAATGYAVLALEIDGRGDGRGRSSTARLQPPTLDDRPLR